MRLRLGKGGPGERVRALALEMLNLSLLSCPGRNEPLKKERLKWKSDYPMTDGQLRSKRDEFWDTAPAFEGRKEIWDALKAAAYAAEANDHELAQAILDGASITLPHGEWARRGLDPHWSEGAIRVGCVGWRRAGRSCCPSWWVVDVACSFRQPLRAWTKSEGKLK